MQKWTPLLVALVIVLALLGSIVFTVYETDRAIIVRLGEFVSDKDKVKVLEPGLHIKVPFIDRVLFFDSRLQISDIPSERIVTKEKKDLIVDLFIQWRIRDYPLFYNKTRMVSADVFLRQNVVDTLRAEFGQRTINTIVSGDRKELLGKLKSSTESSVAGAGMELVDIRIKRIDYPPEVNDAVYDRMRSDRKQFATEIRARGASEADIIRADADNKMKVMVAEAEKDSEKIRGLGDAEASGIYAAAYNKSPEFYEFYRSLDAYKKSFQSNQDILVLKPQGEFFKYFNKSGNVK